MYRQKYWKYKSKYLELKALMEREGSLMIGGSDDEEETHQERSDDVGVLEAFMSIKKLGESAKDGILGIFDVERDEAGKLYYKVPEEGSIKREILDKLVGLFLIIFPLTDEEKRGKKSNVDRVLEKFDIRDETGEFSINRLNELMAYISGVFLAHACSFETEIKKWIPAGMEDWFPMFGGDLGKSSNETINQVGQIGQLGQLGQLGGVADLVIVAILIFVLCGLGIMAVTIIIYTFIVSLAATVVIGLSIIPFLAVCIVIIAISTIIGYMFPMLFAGLKLEGKDLTEVSIAYFQNFPETKTFTDQIVDLGKEIKHIIKHMDMGLKAVEIGVTGITSIVSAGTKALAGIKIPDPKSTGTEDTDSKSSGVANIASKLAATAINISGGNGNGNGEEQPNEGNGRPISISDITEIIETSDWESIDINELIESFKEYPPAEIKNSMGKLLHLPLCAIFIVCYNAPYFFEPMLTGSIPHLSPSDFEKLMRRSIAYEPGKNIEVNFELPEGEAEGEAEGVTEGEA